MSESEYHVASFVARTRPRDEAKAIEQIRNIPGIEVHAHEHGKMIVTAEAGSTRELADLSSRLEQLNTVLQVSPVYHEFTQHQPKSQTQ